MSNLPLVFVSVSMHVRLHLISSFTRSFCRHVCQCDHAYGWSKSSTDATAAKDSIYLLHYTTTAAQELNGIIKGIITEVALELPKRVKQIFLRFRLHGRSLPSAVLDSRDVYVALANGCAICPKAVHVH